MTTCRWALFLQLATTWPLVGVIWFVQIVAYPLFKHVGAAEFGAYHHNHARLITFVVAPLMLGELAGALASVLFPDPALPRTTAWLGASLAIAAWVVTLFAAVPLHNVLARGFDASAHARLLGANWLRTAIWTARGVLLLGMVAR
ncbi:MAG: hypothetical protein RL701_3058 [Pseudomonadota bacterium]|jgi:hypothetical protein